MSKPEDVVGHVGAHRLGRCAARPQPRLCCVATDQRPSDGAEGGVGPGQVPPAARRLARLTVAVGRGLLFEARADVALPITRHLPPHARLLVDHAVAVSPNGVTLAPGAPGPTVVVPRSTTRHAVAGVSAGSG